MGAREFYAAGVAAEVTTTSATVWTPVGALDFAPAAGRDYVVFWSLEAANKSSWTDDVRFRLTVAGAPILSANLEMRAVGEYPSFAGFFRMTGDGLGATVGAEIQAETAGDTVAARNLSLVALALGANDRFAQAAGRTAVTSETFTTLLDMQWTPAAGGDYLLLSSCVVDNFSGTAPAYARMECGAASGAEWPCGTPEAIGAQQSNVPHGFLWRRTLTAGSPASVRWRGRSHAEGATSGWRDVRLLALRLGDFERAVHAELSADDSGAAASFSTALTANEPAASANPHLILANWVTASPSQSMEGAARVLDGGDIVGTSVRRSYANSTTRGTSSALSAVGASAAGARSWTLERRSDGTNAYLVKAGSTIAVLDLGQLGATLAAEPGSMVGAAISARLICARRRAAIRGAHVLAGLSAAMARRYQVGATRGQVLAGEVPALARCGRRFSAEACAAAFLGMSADLVRTSAGSTLSVEAALVALLKPPATFRCARRLAGAPGAHAWSRLAAEMSFGRRSPAARCELVFHGSDASWTQIRVLAVQAASLAFAGSFGGLSYDGAQFWNPAPTEAEIWTPRSARAEGWAHAEVTQEEWS